MKRRIKIVKLQTKFPKNLNRCIIKIHNNYRGDFILKTYKSNTTVKIFDDFISELEKKEEFGCVANACGSNLVPCGTNACIAHVIPCAAHIGPI